MEYLANLILFALVYAVNQWYIFQELGLQHSYLIGPSMWWARSK